MSDVVEETRSKLAGTDVIGILARYAPIIFLIAVMFVFTILDSRFLSPINLFNVMRQVSIVGLLAVGMTFVILTAGIDLSVGALLCLAGLVCAAVSKGGVSEGFAAGSEVTDAGYNWSVVLLAAVAVGLAGGLLQGLTITRLKVPPFVVTLGGMSVFRGVALLFSNGGPISGFEPGFLWWGQGKLGIVPIPVITFLSFALLAHVVLRYTRYGRQVYAVGGNPEAARLSGVDVRRIVCGVYVIAGFFSGLGAFVLSARLNAAEAVAGLGYELTVIASVVIGGTSLFGGSGSILGTVIGTVLIGVLLNGLVILNVSPYVQQIIIGVIIVLAVAFDTFAKSRRRR